MNKRQKALSTVGVLLLLFIAAVSVPNLMRSLPTPQEAAPSRLPARASSNAVYLTSLDNAGSAQPGVPADSASALPDKKLIHNAQLALTVADVRAAAEQIRRITEADHGEIDNLEVTEGSGSVSGTLVVRVPASGLLAALAEYRKLAVRTDHEQVSGLDVTREYYDNQAHLHNLRAEEEQYVTIMKQASSVTEILAVSEKLSDVRDRIERLQAQIRVMTHDIEMSAVNISLTQQSDTRVLGIRWRPLYNAKIATHELLAGLSDWIDWVVTLLIKLPLILLWVLTVGAIVCMVWRVGRAAWPRFVKPKKAGSTPPKRYGPPPVQSTIDPIP